MCHLEYIVVIVIFNSNSIGMNHFIHVNHNSIQFRRRSIFSKISPAKKNIEKLTFVLKQQCGFVENRLRPTVVLVLKVIGASTKSQMIQKATDLFRFPMIPISGYFGYINVNKHMCHLSDLKNKAITFLCTVSTRWVVFSVKIFERCLQFYTLVVI